MAKTKLVVVKDIDKDREITISERAYLDSYRGTKSKVNKRKDRFVVVKGDPAPPQDEGKKKNPVTSANKESQKGADGKVSGGGQEGGPANTKGAGAAKQE